VLIVPGSRDADERTTAGRRITLRSPRLPGSGGAYRVITDRRRLRQLLERLRPDRLEVSDKLTLRCLGSWAQARGIPAVAISHERLDELLAERLPAGLLARRAAAWWNRGLAARFDRVVCTTAWAAAEFSQVAACGQVVRVPLGVDLAEFRPERRSEGLRARLAPDGTALLVYAGRLAPEKRPELAVRALARLRAEGQAARLVIAGQGPTARALAAEAAGLPVTFLGFVSDRRALATLLASADLMIAPGRVETFGLSALESLAAGTPVVSADTGALPELLDPGPSPPGTAPRRPGLTAPADPDEIARAAAAALAAGDTMRQTARRRAEQFPWSATIHGMLAAHGLRPGRDPVSAPTTGRSDESPSLHAR
jgi:alpha-1,6-mannosyltransferase